MDMDDAARVLAENLREMVGMAHQFRDVLLIEGTDNVIDKIGRLTLEVAYLIHEYAKLPLLGKLLLRRSPFKSSFRLCNSNIILP